MKTRMSYSEPNVVEECNLCDGSDRVIRLRRDESRSTMKVDLNICSRCLYELDRFYRQEYAKQEPPPGYVNDAGIIENFDETTTCRRCQAVIARGRYAEQAELSAHERVCPHPRTITS